MVKIIIIEKNKNHQPLEEALLSLKKAIPSLRVR